MLTEDGDCLLVFLASNPAFDAYKKMSQMEQWAPYMKDVDKYVAPLQNCPNPQEKVEQYMMEVGFKSHSVEVRDKTFVYEGTDVLKGELTLIRSAYNDSNVIVIKVFGKLTFSLCQRLIFEIFISSSRSDFTCSLVLFIVSFG